MLLPSDHHVRREAILICALRVAAERLRWRSNETVLLGIEAETPDPQLGYICPAAATVTGRARCCSLSRNPR